MLVDIITCRPQSSPPCGADCTLAIVCARARSVAVKVPWSAPTTEMLCVCVWTKGGWVPGISLRANRQSAGVSVNSVVSCALHTSGIGSPFIKHETALEEGNL
ncbi:hypothetical protein ILYODFUR_003500 [Ilyodon furcidens]|uniref:Uncharacterized protein n=1 Tax=Ilyodon furcidens TaxID=33524 RepID=A0ABV0V1N1_9TELE